MKRVLIAVNVLLTCLVLWTVTTLVMSRPSKERAVGDGVEKRIPEQGSGTKTLWAPRPIADYQALIRQDVFRTSRQRSQGEPAPVKEEKPIEVTKLNLKLKGVVIRSGNRSFAAIMDGGTRKQDIYYLNGTIRNARIAEILHDQVILEINDRREALLLFTGDGEAEKETPSKRTGARQPLGPVEGPHSFRPDPSRSKLGADVASRLPAMIRQKRR